MEWLWVVNEANSTQPYPTKDATEACTRDCCILYTTLEQEARAQDDMVPWRDKHDMHLLQELVEFTGPEHGNPTRCWTYL